MRTTNYDTGVSSLCCVVLRKMEFNMIEKKDVLVNEEHVDTMFDHPTKQRFKGFVHEVPGWMTG